MKQDVTLKGAVMPEEPKRYKISSNSYGITCGEAADTLLRAAEIKANKPLLKAALADLKTRKKALSSLVDESSVDEGSE